MSEAEKFREPQNVISKEVTQTLEYSPHALQDGILYRTFTCISTLDPNELDINSRSITFGILQKSAFINPKKLFMHISLMIVKDAEENGLSIEDGVVPPASPAQQLFDDISVTMSDMTLSRPSTYYSMLVFIQQMLEIPRPIKESWLNFYEGYDDDIDGTYSTVAEAVEKKGEKLVAKNATGRRMIKILNKKTNEYLISLETPLKHFSVLIPTVIYTFFYLKKFNFIIFEKFFIFFLTGVTDFTIIL